MEGSPSAWHNYLYVPDNGGRLMCVDLNTMKPVWVQDIQDDTNASPVFEESIAEGKAYIYVAPSLHITGSGDEPAKGQISIYKIDASTGEKIWTSTPYPCMSRAGVSGGVQGTGVVGRGDIANLVIFPVAGTPSVAPGLLVALDKSTGRRCGALPWPTTRGAPRSRCTPRRASHTSSSVTVRVWSSFSTEPQAK